MLGMKARSDRLSAVRTAAAACLVVVATAGVTGCYARAGAATSIQIATAYVPQPVIPGQTVAYVVIRNNGPRPGGVPRRRGAEHRHAHHSVDQHSGQFDRPAGA